MATPIKCHIMKHNNHLLESTPELTNKTHLCKIVENAASWESFHTADQDTTNELESVGMVAGQGTIKRQDRSGSMYSNGKNAGNKH
eukprot:4618764-Ditylum_brightwellii.AAC.1